METTVMYWGYLGHTGPAIGDNGKKKIESTVMGYIGVHMGTMGNKMETTILGFIGSRCHMD